MVTVLCEQIGDLLDIDSVVEWSGITNFPLVSRDFALQAFDHVTNGHTTGHGVGVHDEVRGDSLTREWHVLKNQISKSLYMCT